MKAKEILARLEIVKLATTIGDHDTILIQTDNLSNANSSRLNEISTLLNSKNYRQALYLIKGYISQMGETETFSTFDPTDDGEKVLDIEDMLRMSPLAKETIRDYKRSAYTSDDIEAFSKNIDTSIASEYSSSKFEKVATNFNESQTDIELEPKIEDAPKEVDYVKSIENEIKEQEPKIEQDKKIEIDDTIDNSSEIIEAVESADKETPLDEISAEVLGSSTKKSRTKVLSKYKTLREKFSKKSKSKEIKEIKQVEKDNELEVQNIQDDSADKIENKEKVIENNSIKEEKKIENIEKDEKIDISISANDETEAKEVIVNKDEIKDNSNVEEAESKLSKEEKKAQEKKDIETIYAPIPHIEEKFRQAFVLYPPLKESEIWVEEVIKFLKNVSKNSFTERDVKILLDEYDYYLEKRDIAKASQILLLASTTESDYAKFLLARELFSGKVVARDLKKSFTIMKYLANKFYPEAVCDLGQFYEYGIGVPKDKKIAIKLYEKAFELGVSRATKHISRLKESNGILSTIFKLK